MTSSLVCLKCLNTILFNEIVQPTTLEYYHISCHNELITYRNNKITEDLVDITESIVIDSSDNPINLKYDFDNKISKYVDLSSDNKILDHITSNIHYNTNDDYAMDIAGNMVKLDKQYIISHKFKKW